MADPDLRAFYLRYLQRCHAHDLGSLGEFVADVEVNGDVQGVETYVSGLRSVVEAFPTTTGTFATCSSMTPGCPRTSPTPAPTSVPSWAFPPPGAP
jgi:hypothetical protein